MINTFQFWAILAAELLAGVAILWAAVGARMNDPDSK